MDNVKLLNAIRKQASAEYNERIPKATKDNLKKISEALDDFPNTKNEFLNILTNKIGKTMFLTKVLKNPYSFFKKGTLEYGNTIEAIFADLIIGKSFGEYFGDNETTSLVGKTTNENVHIEYYEENYRNKYKITISDERLKSAFNSVNGLFTMLGQLMQSAINSATYDEYIMIKKCLNIAPMKEHVLDSSYNTLSDKEKSVELTVAIKEKILSMELPSSNYNSKGVVTTSLPNEVVVLVTPKTKARIDVDLLATAFNIEKAEIQSRLVLIDGFTKANTSTGAEEPDPLTEAIICDENLIQFHETLNKTENFRNADGLYTNTFIHRWGTLAVCNFVNATKIKRGA